MTHKFRITVITILFLCFMQGLRAQTGLNFQGVARTNNNVILASQQIVLRLSIIQNSPTGTIEYVETRNVTTNAQGLFTAVIGNVDAQNTIGNFNTINWKNIPKYLKIEMDPAGGNNFITLGTTQFQYVPYAEFANGVDALNLSGIVPVQNGGTGVASISLLKKALAIDQINNTADSSKPISIATQNALSLKISGKELSDSLKLKTNNKDISDSLKLKANITDLSAYATIVSLGAKVNITDLIDSLKLKISYKDISDSLKLKTNNKDLSDSLKLKANITDLSAYATTASLGLKVNFTDLIDSLKLKTSYKDISDSLKLKTNNKDISDSLKLKANITDLSAYATIVSLGAKVNITDLIDSLKLKTSFKNLSDSLKLKANVSELISGLLLKENIANKSIANDLGGATPSDDLYPSQKAVKDYIAANNASGGVADGGITTVKLADAAVSFQKFQSIPTNTILGNTSSSTSSLQAINTTGTDLVVLSNNPTIESPTLITPNIGDATATSINNVVINSIGSRTATITVLKGEAFIEGINRGGNTGDNAVNTLYEPLRINGIVDLTTDQTIAGQKSFMNDLTMANMVTVSGTPTPTIIKFANGSQIGDIQNINEGSPDIYGSIDLFARGGASWVQLNYDNSNYIALDQSSAHIDIGPMNWDFENNGLTKFPNSITNGKKSDHMGMFYYNYLDYNGGIDFAVEGANLNLYSDDPVYGFNRDWNFNNDGSTNFPGGIFNSIENPRMEIAYKNQDGNVYSGIEIDDESLDLKLRSYDPITKAYNYNLRWSFNPDGTTSFPGNLNLQNQSNINFLSSTNPTKSNSSIYADGPYINIATRDATEEEFSDDSINKGIELRYGTNTGFYMDYNGVYFSTQNVIDQYNSISSIAGINKTLFYLDLSNQNATIQNHWIFDGETRTTTFPGDLKLGGTIYPSVPNNEGDILTLDRNGNAIWQAPSNNGNAVSGITSINGVTAGTQSFTVDNSGSDPTINDFTILSDLTTGVHTFKLPEAKNTNSGRGLLSKSDWDTFNSKQNAGEIININQNASNEFGLLISSQQLPSGYSPTGPKYGSTIGFESNIGSSSNFGSFQLDLEGNMVFRTLQKDMYFDNFGNNSVYFRSGKLNGTDPNGKPKYDLTTTMTIDNAGNLNVPGNVNSLGTLLSGNSVLSSDIRLKKNILPLKNSLSVIGRLHPVSYDKKQRLVDSVYTMKENGFIAQELQKVLPNLVNESNDSDKLLSVNYTAIIPILTKGIQEQQLQIEALKKELKLLKKLIQTRNKSR